MSIPAAFEWYQTAWSMALVEEHQEAGLRVPSTAQGHDLDS